MNGKGSARRPRDNRYCTEAREAENWDRVFGSSKPNPDPTPQKPRPEAPYNPKHSIRIK